VRPSSLAAFRLRTSLKYVVPGLERAQVKGGEAGGHLELEKIRLLVGQAELGVRPRAHERAGANLELHIARGCGRHLVARREGSIDLRRRPVLRTRAPVRDLPVREDVPP